MFLKIVFTGLSLLIVSTSLKAAQVHEYAKCKEADFVEIQAAEVQIEFAGTSYEPACLKVKAGTKVTLPASNRHPLQGAADFDGVANPFRNTTEVGEFLESQIRSLDVPGFFGYFCTRHGDPTDGSGMGGMIWVVPSIANPQ
jgi:plastocyanin